MRTLETFYQSKEWARFRQAVIAERTAKDGFVYDEITHEPILRKYDIILHHTVFLTDQNVGDAAISLNPELIQIVSHRTHNRIHEKLGSVKREVFLVYGPPMSGLLEYVEGVRGRGDLLISLDEIWKCIEGTRTPEKSPRLNSVAFGMRDYLIDCVRCRRGKWQNAYICGGYPMSSERERLCRQLGAREIFIDMPREECEARLRLHPELDQAEWMKWIAEWWEKYQYTPPFIA